MAVSHVVMPTSQGSQDKSTAQISPDEESRVQTLAEIAPGLDVPLATAAVLSARFPLVTPVGTVQGKDRTHRFVDGGYFENSGLTTVLDVVEALRQAPGKVETRLVIVRIENSRATTDMQSIAGAPKRNSDSYFAEAAAPVRALLATRHARGELARATVARVVRDAEAACAAEAAARTSPAQLPEPVTGCVRVEEVVFALEPACVPIPLGWSLTEIARRDMRRQLLNSKSSKSCRSENPAGPERNAQSLKRVLELVGARERAASAASQ
jgi:hypothetical protein